MTDKLNIIKEKIKLYILQSSNAEENIINNDTPIFKEGYFDSMGIILLIDFIEEEFCIKTNEKDLKEDNFKSINSISDYVYQKMRSSIYA